MLNWGTGLDGATVDVQIGFGSPPGTAIASISWTSVTTYVRALSFSHGRSTELDGYQGGRLSATLDNRDRRFDPLHATGPYFGNLKPMVPIRVRVTYSATTVTAWSGFVSGWPQSYNPPRDAIAQITASDGFVILQQARLPSEYAYQVGLDTPTVWYRLGEQQGTKVVDASGNGRDGTYVGGATFSSRAGLVVDTDTAIAFSGSAAINVSPIAWPAFPFSIEFWFQQTLATSTFYLMRVASGTREFLDVTFEPGRITVNLSDGTNTLSRSSNAATYNDGLTHHVVATWSNATTAPHLYIDGVDDTGGSSTASGTSAALGTVSIELPPNIGGGPFAGTLDEFAVYPSALSSARVASHYANGVGPYVGQDTGTIIGHLLDIIGWPSADRTIETGKSTVVSFDISGRTALEVIQDLERSEQGRFFISRDGKATFYNRHHTLTTTASVTSQATFGDSGAELPYGDVNSDFDVAQIRNVITTQRAGDSPFVVKDATSITTYLQREFSITGLLNSSDSEIRDMGLWQLGHYKDPQTRIPEIVINPRRSPTTLFPQLRDRALCDRVTVKRRPQNVGSVISLDFLIEGTEHTLVEGSWTVHYTLSPVDAVGYLVLDHATLGKLDNNRLAF